MAYALWCGSFSPEGEGGGARRSSRSLKIVPARETESHSDASLVERLWHDDVEVFHQLFVTYYPLLHRFLYRWTGDEAVADDIAQGVMADLWERRHSLLVHASLKSYLFAAARYRVRDALSHDAVVERYSREHQLDPTFAITPSTDSSVLADELIRLAEQRIAAMPPRMQTIYRLSRDAGLSYAEIAAQLGISVNTVYVQMGRALAGLRDILGDWTE